MELKKIKANAALARGNIEKLGDLYATLAEKSGQHASDIADLVKDVSGMVTDLDTISAATKNSVDNSNSGGQQQPPPPPPTSQ